MTEPSIEAAGIDTGKGRLDVALAQNHKPGNQEKRGGIQKTDRHYGQSISHHSHAERDDPRPIEADERFGIEAGFALRRKQQHRECDDPTQNGEKIGKSPRREYGLRVAEIELDFPGLEPVNDGKGEEEQGYHRVAGDHVLVPLASMSSIGGPSPDFSNHLMHRGQESRKMAIRQSLTAIPERPRTLHDAIAESAGI